MNTNENRPVDATRRWRRSHGTVPLVDARNVEARWRTNGMLDRHEAEHKIRRGALRQAASMLLSQNTQQIAVVHELYPGARQLSDTLAMGRSYW
jgi:hypothetical protein